MKEIGEQLKQAREKMGVSLEEAAEDLQLKPSLLESIENGDRSAFKDVFTLKQVIKDYAKYLGLEHEKFEDEFNEFVFVFTSKIPLDDIAKANKEKKKVNKQDKEITSPYTVLNHNKHYLWTIILIVIGILMIALAGYFLFESIQHDNYAEHKVISNLNM